MQRHPAYYIDTMAHGVTYGSTHAQAKATSMRAQTSGPQVTRREGAGARFKLSHPYTILPMGSLPWLLLRSLLSLSFLPFYALLITTTALAWWLIL